MGQPIHPRSPDDEEPPSALQSQFALCLPTLGAQRLPLNQCCLPGLLPRSIAHRIALHQHRVDVLPTPAHLAVLRSPVASAHSAAVCSSWLSCSRLSPDFSLYFTTSLLRAKK
jgi:hypothetical protein